MHIQFINKLVFVKFADNDERSALAIDPFRFLDFPDILYLLWKKIIKIWNFCSLVNGGSSKNALAEKRTSLKMKLPSLRLVNFQRALLNTRCRLWENISIVRDGLKRS